MVGLCKAFNGNSGHPTVIIHSGSLTRFLVCSSLLDLHEASWASWVQERCVLNAATRNGEHLE